MTMMGIGRLGLTLLLAFSSPSLVSAAAASVDVALQASFPSPPYLVELLETAAEENATAYFPILDRIAEGHFDSAKTDEDLFKAFLKTLEQDGHLSKPEDLSSFKLALSIHSAAPRVEAHYQYYNTTAKATVPSSPGREDKPWLRFNDRIYYDADLSGEGHSVADTSSGTGALPFDRILGNETSASPSIIYADITSPSFRNLHKTISATAKSGKTSYRVRYKLATGSIARPLSVSGYGVELALKRTDYIVIDDREAGDASKEEEGTPKKAGQTVLKDEEDVADLKPLSASELRRLGLKAATFVMDSSDRFETLLKLSQDFPKHSGAIAATEVSDLLKAELTANGEKIMPPGYNALWINGRQTLGRDLDAFALLEQLRRERKLVSQGKALGLSGDQTIKLISHSSLNEVSGEPEVQRYDWRDDIEGNNVIIWMNNIQKDKRYADWPENPKALLQRTFPGQLPPVRKDIHNVILPLDFTNKTDVMILIDSVQSFVTRMVPLRFGLVPLTTTPEAEQAAKLVYNLVDTYGLAIALKYLEHAFPDLGKKASPPSKAHFDEAISGREPRKNRTALAFDASTSTSDPADRIESARSYLTRLGDATPSAPYIANGVPITRNEDWMQAMSQRVSTDLRTVQQAVYTETVDEDAWLPSLFLKNASPRRNPLIIPEDEKSIKIVNLADFPELQAGKLGEIPSFPASPSTIESELVQMMIVTDLDSWTHGPLWRAAAQLLQDHDNIELFVVHSGGPALRYGLNQGLYHDLKSGEPITPGSLIEMAKTTEGVRLFEYAVQPEEEQKFWASAKKFAEAVDTPKRTASIVIDGRVVGPFSEDVPVTSDDLEMLLAYERKKRLLPVAKALKDLDLLSMASTPNAFSRLANLVSLSAISDVPEGIFEGPPSIRMSVPDLFKTQHCGFEIGDRQEASVQVAAAIDPASESAQRWLPIIKALSEMAGVHTKIIMNPKDRLEELPVKRFYRHVLTSTPSFDASGAVRDQVAHFSGLPADALLTIGMDLPPAWLVSPKDSVHDLDNLRISSIKADKIEATYQLDHILIEGHSRDTTTGGAPRGTQLILSTGSGDRFADTLIMANIGYFQFKANPGFYNLSLQKGRSQEVYQIDDAGKSDKTTLAGEGITEIALSSFRGTTLFPKLSRRPGMEAEDVLEPSKSSLEKTMDTLSDTAGNVMNALGLDKTGAGGWLNKASQKVMSLSNAGGASKDVSTLPHADINIFSVASGHLYERMLNIMMVSVMKHTSHTVKFWFIEQFLSPSFKEFLPVMAEEYGFKYEMVTYKWPHWLRSQKEKQREIWGYKILFLDVLFPLDLNKVIFVDADQIVRTDMYELVQYNLQGAPYGFTPMCDSRTEMEGFRFWKQGYWKNFLRGLPYHISALYVVDLARFRQMAAGDRLRQQYHQLSADPESLSNLDQDLPNHMQHALPIHSLPQEWLWCETWCSDESLGVAKTIDLCNNPQTKEPKLERARRQVPEWTVYDEEIATLGKRKKGLESVPGLGEGKGEQERLQAEEYKRKLEERRAKDEL